MGRLAHLTGAFQNQDILVLCYYAYELVPFNLQKANKLSRYDQSD